MSSPHDFPADTPRYDPEPLDIPRLLAESFIARVEHRARIGSTNDLARELAGAVRADTVLVIADEQTAGRGRGTNRWWTGASSLACSVLHDPAARGVAQCRAALVSLATAVAIVETVAPLLSAALRPGDLGLHWPNDVFVVGKKLAGILVETLPDGRQIVGIGLNVNNTLADAPADVRARATSLRDLAGRWFDRTATLLMLLDRLDAAWRRLADDPESLGREFNEHCLQHGRELTIEHGLELVTGVCAGVALDGALLLDAPQGRRKFYAGALRHSG